MLSYTCSFGAAAELSKEPIKWPPWHWHRVSQGPFHCVKVHIIINASEAPPAPSVRGGPNHKPRVGVHYVGGQVEKTNRVGVGGKPFDLSHSKRKVRRNTIIMHYGTKPENRAKWMY